MRIPAVLTEADAHLGLANRLAAPFAKRLLARLSDRDAVADEVPRRRPPDPGALAGDPAGRGARDLRAAAGRARCSSSFGALAGAKSLNEYVVETWGEVGPAILHITGGRDYER